MLSRLNFFLSIVILYLITNLVHAHSIKPSIVEYRIFGKNIELNLSINAEVFLSGIDASKFIDTANAPQVKLYDELRRLQIDELESKIRESIDSLKDSVYLKVDQKMLSLNLNEINVQDVEDEENIRITIISFKTTAPEDGKTITFAWKKELGSLIFRDFSMEIDNEVSNTNMDLKVSYLLKSA